MSNDYYDHTSYPATGAVGSSSALRSELDTIEQGFDKLPTITGNGSKIIAVNSGATALEAIATTGTGSGVRATSPTLVTPILGVATVTSVNKITWTQPATGATVTIADGKTLTWSNSLTVTATDGSTLAVGAGGTLGTVAYSTASPTSGNILTGNGSAWVSSPPAATGAMDERAITGADTVGVADIGNLVKITSGTFTLAFSAAATLVDKSSGWIWNDGTGIVTLDPNGTETIDGLTNYPMYPGECRRWYVEGSTIKTKVEQAYFYTYTSSGTFTQPPGYKATGVIAIGPGGSGGSGCRDAAGTARSGGTGGGGGVRTSTILNGLTVGGATTVTVGAAGAVGAAVTANTTAGNNAAAGGTTSFGTLLLAYAGGAGGGGLLATASGGGGGGGSAGSGGNGDVGSPGAVVGGLPSIASTIGAISSATNAFNTGGGGAASATTASGCAEFGGGSGGGTTNAAVGITGGSSIYGGPGGGGGGGITAANAATVGAAGGAINSYAAGGGAAGGAATGATGTAGTAGTFGRCGTGGGGGGGAAAAAGGAGGAGGAPGGGGGGGAGSLNGNNSGAGGLGGRGEVQVWGII